MTVQGSGGDFTLAEWLVQPSLNRITRGTRSVQLEPKQMDVLVLLADHAGEVVSKDAIADGVWKQKYYSEWVITRAVATLRKALGDDARQPRFIETISKRGYRLLAPVTSGIAGAAVRPHTAATARVPFTVGQWVRGDGFYGRDAEILEILSGNRNCLWVLGTRQIGKTSLLKQVEHIARDDPRSPYFPIYWDLQGVEEPAELSHDLAGALLDAEDRLATLGISPAQVDRGDLFLSLATLRRAISANGRRLLLLFDEAEQLLHLKDRDAMLLPKLRRALQSPDDLRCVIASSSRLWALADHHEETSPFLHGFTPPLYLGPLGDPDARALVGQMQLAGEPRPTASLELVGQICGECGNHPYLLQLLCSRLLEVGELPRAIESVAADPTVAHLFAVDLQALSAPEKAVLHAVLAGPRRRDELSEALQARPESVASSVHTLERLGLLGRAQDDRHYLSNAFFARWLASRPTPAVDH